MRNCWPDGDLRAYLDGEVTADTQASIAAHLEDCAACGGRYRELAERAQWVSSTMALSADARPLPVRRSQPRRWAVVALAVAAALAVTFVLWPKHAAVRSAPAVAGAAPPLEPSVTPPVLHRVIRRVVHHTAPRPLAPEEFVRLDDDPIETATVVRISADNGALQADLIVGPDGRAHAIRIVRSQ